METSKKRPSSSSITSSSSSSSSSICLELFGPKEAPPTSSSPTSTTSVFGSVFGSPPTERGIESPYTPAKGMGGTRNQESIQPWNYNSSIYYGGQDFYYTSSVDTKPQYKKDEQDGDSDGSSPHGVASRGNWWQGSVYY